MCGCVVLGECVCVGVSMCGLMSMCMCGRVLFPPYPTASHFRSDFLRSPPESNCVDGRRHLDYVNFSFGLTTSTAGCTCHKEEVHN